jgi:hypothetical protein
VYGPRSPEAADLQRPLQPRRSPTVNFCAAFWSFNLLSPHFVAGGGEGHHAQEHRRSTEVPYGPRSPEATDLQRTLHPRRRRKVIVCATASPLEAQTSSGC